MKVTERIKSRWQQFSAMTRLGVFAGLSGIVYLAFALPFPLHRLYNIIPPLDYAKLTRHSAFGFVAYLLGVLALFGLYILSLRIFSTNPIEEVKAIRLILLGGAAFGLISVFSYPQTAIDLFVYALRTRGWALYGLSPFTVPPEGLPASDPWLGLAGEWADSASPYGLVWEWLSLGIYQLDGGNYLAHLIGLKFLSLAAYLGCAWLIYQTIRYYQPDWAIIGTVFFAWNPLVLFEGVANAHNDILMACFLLTAIWAFSQLTEGSQKRKLFWFGLFVVGFAASILVKFVTLLIFPFFLFTLALQEKTWPRRFFVFIILGLTVTVIAVLAMRSYWPGLENWAVLDSGKEAGRSLVALLVLILREQIGTRAAFDAVNGVIYAILGMLYLGCLWQVWQRAKNQSQAGSTLQKARFEAPIWASFWVFFWYILLGVSTFHAWYLLWFIPLGSFLIPQVRPTSGAIIFSLFALLIIPYYETVRVWLPYLNTNHILGHLIGVSLLAVPVTVSLWLPARIFRN